MGSRYASPPDRSGRQQTGRQAFSPRHTAQARRLVDDGAGQVGFAMAPVGAARARAAAIPDRPSSSADPSSSTGPSSSAGPSGRSSRAGRFRPGPVAPGSGQPGPSRQAQPGRVQPRQIEQGKPAGPGPVARPSRTRSGHTRSSRARPNRQLRSSHPVAPDPLGPGSVARSGRAKSGGHMSSWACQLGWCGLGWFLSLRSGSVRARLSSEWCVDLGAWWAFLAASGGGGTDVGAVDACGRGWLAWLGSLRGCGFASLCLGSSSPGLPRWLPGWCRLGWCWGLLAMCCGRIFLTRPTLSQTSSVRCGSRVGAWTRFLRGRTSPSFGGGPTGGSSVTTVGRFGPLGEPGWLT